MSLSSDYTWTVLAEKLPPTLNSRLPGTDLAPSDSPSCYGIDPDKDGKLTSGSCPTGTAAIEKQYTIGANTYSWFFNRLWRISGNQLIYGAPEYTASYYAQGLGHIDFPEDAGTIIKILPVGDSLMVFKATGAYIIPNASSHNAGFTPGNIIQECYTPTATQAVSIGGAAYVSNASGLFVLTPNGETAELTLPVRGSSIFVNTVLTASYDKKYLVGATNQYCYDLANKKLFDYSTAGFLFTSRSLRMTGRELKGNPFTVSRIAFEIEHTAAADGQLVFSTQFDARGWNDPQTLDVLYDRGTTERVDIDLDVQENCRAFKIKITTLTGLSIRRIYVNSNDFTQNSFAD